MNSSNYFSINNLINKKNNTKIMFSLLIQKIYIYINKK